MTTQRYLHLTLITLLIVLFYPIVSLAQSNGSPKEAINRLLRYQGDDLFCLDVESHKDAESLVDRILPKDKNLGKSTRRLWESWYVWEIPGVGNQHLIVLVEIPTILTVPGQAAARVNFFDDEGKHLAAPEVSLGWRINPRTARLIRNSSIGYPLLEVSSEPFINGREIGRQYFVLKGTNVFLVRLETAEGELLRNRFGSPSHTIGRVVPSRSADAWMEVLASSDKAEVLEALAWLGGVHATVEEAKSENEVAGMKVESESVDDAKLVSAVRARKDVRKLIKGLTKSTNRWIREAAELALKPETDDE